MTDSNRLSDAFSADDDSMLANKFQTYFTNKIKNIRSTFGVQENMPVYSYPNVARTLSEFELSTENELRTLVKSHKVSCSAEDPMVSQCLKENLDFILPVWVELVNKNNLLAVWIV